MEIRSSTRDWLVEIGEQIRALRIAANLEQASLAERANLSPTTVHNLETGRGATLSTFVKLLRALDRTDWLEQIDPLAGAPDPFDALADAPPRPRQRVRRQD